MELRLLRYFAMVAEELHFGRAADRLNISQPPLSQQIKRLELEIGTELFVRSRRKVELTAAGAILKEQVPLIFSQIESALHQTRAVGRGHIGKLEIGVISSMMCGVLPRSLRIFKTSYPNVDWSLREMAPDAQVAAVSEKRLDICFLRSRYEGSDLVAEPLLREPLAVALAGDHPLAGLENIRLEQLASEPLILFDIGQSEFATYLRKCCLEVGIEPNVSHQVVEIQTLLSLVREGLGTALLPSSTEGFAHDGIVYRPLGTSAPETTLYAIYRRKNTSPTLEMFLNIIRSQLPDT